MASLARRPIPVEIEAAAAGFGTQQPSRAGKLGWVWATYREVGATCIRTCPLLIDGTCYALQGLVNLQQKKAARLTFVVERWLRGLPFGAFVRHTISGDLFKNVGTVEQPRMVIDWDYLNGLLAGHRARPDIRAWLYTHGWRLFDTRPSAPGLCMNASCDYPHEVPAALEAGWPVVLTVPMAQPRLERHERFMLIVCPQQIDERRTCDRCMLCAKGDRMSAGLPVVIGFRAHSNKEKALDARLTAGVAVAS